MSIKLPKLSRFQLFVHLASWVPFVWVLIDFFRDNLTVNPIQALTLRTGKYALIFLILSLSCTPLNTVFGFTFYLASEIGYPFAIVVWGGRIGIADRSNPANQAVIKPASPA